MLVAKACGCLVNGGQLLQQNRFMQKGLNRKGDDFSIELLLIRGMACSTSPQQYCAFYSKEGGLKEHAQGTIVTCRVLLRKMAGSDGETDKLVGEWELTGVA